MILLLGDITVTNINITVVSDLNGASPQFTLTCISIGGPATTVTWTRDNVTVTNGTETVLNDQVTAQYTHTLTVTGRLPGLYTCTVTNNKPSADSVNFSVQSIYTVIVFILLLIYVGMAKLTINSEAIKLYKYVASLSFSMSISLTDGMLRNGQ